MADSQTSDVCSAVVDLDTGYIMIKKISITGLSANRNVGGA